MGDGAGRSIEALAGMVSRRGFVAGGLVLTGGVAVPVMGAAALPTRKAPPQIAFHADRLYLDRSGGAEAYVAPAGLKSLEGLSEDALRRLVYHP